MELEAATIRQNAFTLLDRLVRTVFHANEFTTIFRDMFKVRPQSQGTYLVSGTCAATANALDALERLRASKHLTPRVVERWMRTWASLAFVPSFLLEIPDRFRSKYRPAEGVMVRVELCYSDENDVAHQTWYANYVERPMTDDQVWALRSARLKQAIDAGLPPEFIAEAMAGTSIVDAELADDSDEARERRRARAEDLLERRACFVCRRDPSSFKCSQCKLMHYCSAACQRADWPTHKGMCASVRHVGEVLAAAAKGNVESLTRVFAVDDANNNDD